MTIKEVAEKFNITADTLRFYEKEGLIRNVPRVNGIRNYGERELGNIEFVICMRGAGIPFSGERQRLSNSDVDKWLNNLR